MRIKSNILLTLVLLLTSSKTLALDNKGISHDSLSPERFTLIEKGQPLAVIVADADNPGVKIAAGNLAADFGRVCGTDATLITQPNAQGLAADGSALRKGVVIAGTLGTPVIDRLVKSGKIKKNELAGRREKYIMTFVENPMEGVGEALVIAGSDRRGTIYGIYELSEQLGVSPWYDWADVPVTPLSDLSIERGTYTAGEPAVKYRGIFLNDEAPCLTGWVKNTYGTDYGDHNFYGRLFELILRLRGNFLWPAMWSWAFYADDPQNGPTANDMGVIIGTSHHEPMARNHQEWARHRKENGVWNYQTNQAVIDKFFADGIDRMKGTEDVVTIGMRGDGDEAMSEEADVALLEKVIKNQREIIKKHTGRKASETPQVWALYKEVLDYYDKGLRVPDDVTLLLCDDNWGNVRRLPNAEERKHPGGWGMYYHVDYVGAPRNSKLLNCTQAQHMWEQMQLTYDYGVDRLWVLNVGDLKPMEYPITLFLDMAWNPRSHTAADITEHTRSFFANQLGEENAEEAARIFSLLTKYNGRCTPEMLDKDTYSLQNGEWRRVCDDYLRLENEALRQYMTLAPEYRDAYQELILFPLQLMANLHDMYYSQAMNHALYAAGLPEANEWAAKVEKCFNRDAALMKGYNKDIANGKWDGMMTQKHIGYTSWSDAFPRDTMPQVLVLEEQNATTPGCYHYQPSAGYVAIEAPRYFAVTQPEGEGRWTVIPDLGRTVGAISVMPYTADVKGADINYAVALPKDVDKVKVHVIVKSTLAFSNLDGHRYKVGFKGGDSREVNFNSDLNEAPANIYTTFYPTVARRVVEKEVELPVPAHADGEDVMLTLTPLDPGVVFEKIVIDYGGYQPGYLFGEESPCSRI